jgi:hypothetical protein
MVPTASAADKQLLAVPLWICIAFFPAFFLSAGDGTQGPVLSYALLLSHILPTLDSEAVVSSARIYFSHGSRKSHWFSVCSDFSCWESGNDNF